jgi:hypothetical protein
MAMRRKQLLKRKPKRFPKPLRCFFPVGRPTLGKTVKVLLGQRCRAFQIILIQQGKVSDSTGFSRRRREARLECLGPHPAATVRVDILVNDSEHFPAASLSTGIGVIMGDPSFGNDHGFNHIGSRRHHFIATSGSVVATMIFVVSIREYLIVTWRLKLAVRNLTGMALEKTGSACTGDGRDSDREKGES